jgi:hypothetical protein
MRTAAFLIALFILQGLQPQTSGSIEGFVVQVGTSTPVVGANVDVFSETGTSSRLRTATTDANGHFVILDLAPGRYRVSAFRAGFVPGHYGDLIHSSRGAPVTVNERQEVKDIVVALTPMGAISGRVYDRADKAVADATVRAMKYTYQDARRILVPVASAKTNASGEYQLVSLGPASYVIGAIPPDSTVEKSEAFLPVYYPGTADAATASVIELPAGVNFNGVDLVVTQTRSVSVRGRVINGVTNEPAAGLTMTLVPRRGTVATGSSQRVSTSLDGVFEIPHIAPGAYDVVATTNANGRLAAHALVDVGFDDVENLSLTLRPQFSISGRIYVDGARDGIPNPAANNVRIELRREPYTPALLVVVPNINPDGSFTLAGVTQGDYELRVRLAGVRAYVKSARFGGIDALNAPFHIDDPAPAEIVLSLNSGSIDGVVYDNTQQPVPDATVVLIPDPPHRQRLDLYYSLGSDASGRIHLDSITPGDYRIFAWQDAPTDAWQDPDFIRAYEDRGRPLHIGEGSHVDVELRLIR